MNIHRSINLPSRLATSWEEKWNGPDQGLIACWERGRKKASEDPILSSQARDGKLVLLPWKGGVEKAIKLKQKYGSLNYLAMWQGLRGEGLNINTEEETVVTCTATKMVVVFTNDLAKTAEA